MVGGGGGGEGIVLHWEDNAAQGIADSSTVALALIETIASAKA